MQWLRLCCPHAPAALRRLSQRLPVVVEPGANVERSYVVRGVVFGAVLAHAQMPVLLANVKFVVLRWAPKSGRDVPSCERVLVAATSDDARSLRQASTGNLDKLLVSLRRAKIAAVVTTAHVR